MAYKSDRNFTDYVHKLALRDIYPEMDWVVNETNNDLNKNIDVNNAVDYQAVDDNRNIIYIQERFREKKYSLYSDFTLRYMRPENPHEDRKKSEFFKIQKDSHYLIYGIIDSSKEGVNQESSFLKYAVINLSMLMGKIDDGTVLINEKMVGNHCEKIDETMHCPIINNRDSSSNFVPFDILILRDIAADVIVKQEGFY